jgi:hypothetical protein
MYGLTVAAPQGERLLFTSADCRPITRIVRLVQRRHPGLKVRVRHWSVGGNAQVPGSPAPPAFPADGPPRTWPTMGPP